MLKYSDLESKRFKLKTLRGSFEQPDFEAILAQLKNEEWQLCILRIPVEFQTELYKIYLTGYQALHADTLVYYSGSLTDIAEAGTGKTLDAGYKICLKENRDAEDLSQIVPLIFKEYTTHYASNPVLDRKLINEGYTEWAVNYCISNEADKQVFVVEANGKVVGFITLGLYKESATIEGVLNGVLPEHEGKGLYSALLKAAAEFGKSLGYTRFIISTQIQNFRVQKVWQRHGLSLYKAYQTIHLINNERV